MKKLILVAATIALMSWCAQAAEAGGCRYGGGRYHRSYYSHYGPSRYYYPSHSYRSYYHPRSNFYYYGGHRGYHHHGHRHYGHRGGVSLHFGF